MATHFYYEFPLNERIRAFMRLEQLFKQLNYFLAKNTIWDRRATIDTLLNIINLFSRHDLKSEILKELDRHSMVLNQVADNQGVDLDKFNEMLQKIKEISKILFQSSGRTGNTVMANELFKSISQRSTILGGTCCFDLPAYHFWLGQDEAEKIKDLQEWVQPFTHTNMAINLMMKAVRESRLPSQEIAKAGFFQSTLEKNASYQLIRIKLAKEVPCFVEISGSKYCFTARFMNPSSDGGERPKQTTDDIPFEMTCCQF